MGFYQISETRENCYYLCHTSLIAVRKFLRILRSYFSLYKRTNLLIILIFSFLFFQHFDITSLEHTVVLMLAV
jgi:hypothetical protein